MRLVCTVHTHEPIQCSFALCHVLYFLFIRYRLCQMFKMKLAKPKRYSEPKKKKKQTHSHSHFNFRTCKAIKTPKEMEIKE